MNANIGLLEALYQEYQKNPQNLDPSWRQYFQQIDSQKDKSAAEPIVKSSSSLANRRIARLIEAYRQYGHLAAKINPIALKETPIPAPLDWPALEFQPSEQEQVFPTEGLLAKEEAPLHEMMTTLKKLYSHQIGFEYKAIVNPDVEQWIQHEIETGYFNRQLSLEQRKMILHYLNRSELFESFLHTKYVGQKRFSLEGAETLIPMLALLIERGGESDLEEVVLGMAHRGRLNVLSNILHKSYKEIFSEFEEGYIAESFEGTGDVKYHKGYTSDFVLTHTGKKIKVTLPPNPSHLESVDPVVEGITRAKQLIRQDEDERRRIIPILVHGDAALSGQGIIYETIQFNQLPGYKTGGTLHIVINNQIGFTTLPRDARSTIYCTDIAKAFGAPVFHVNAEDPETCVLATFFAHEIRQRFHCDVFIDMYCYRKYGHNESDEPAFTQPLEYQVIRKKRPIRELYRDYLIGQGILEKKMVEQLEFEFKKDLQKEHENAKAVSSHAHDQQLMQEPKAKYLFETVETKVSEELLRTVAQQFSVIPSNFKIHPKLEHLIHERLAMVTEHKPIDWGMGEYLAYGTLLWQGIPIRISGQDVGRGTFSHRHAIWVDQDKEQEYFPLAHLKEGQGRFEIWNSPLSEFGVLGFEYGYSVACLNGLTIWEAQFGDFSNGAQVIIDQYIASAEQKWGQQSGLVLFLPHGYEGQGPEHSSGRIERFLTLAGHENMIIVNPTTPAQFFHLLRRQVLGPIRKPLVVFTPKGLLRYPAAASSVDELTTGHFQDILDDPADLHAACSLVLCSGRVYYDLLAERIKQNRTDVALVRIEQLYPLHQARLKEIVDHYKNCREIIWVQEEPKNMGPWHFIRSYLEEILPHQCPLRYVGRSTSASPATGSHSHHHHEYLNILKQVFNYEK